MPIHVIQWTNRRGDQCSVTVYTDAEAERQCRVRWATGCAAIRVDGAAWVPPQERDVGDGK